MTKEQAIELINNSDNCYSLWDAEELLEDCKFKIRQNFTSNRWYIMATDIYEVEDGYIGAISLVKQVIERGKISNSPTTKAVGFLETVFVKVIVI